MDSEDFKSFLKSYPWEPLFPLGSDIPIPTAQELEFANLISQQNFTCRDEILGIANSLDTSDFYTLITFSVRMAIFSMRVHDVKALKAGIVCFMIWWCPCVRLLQLGVVVQLSTTIFHAHHRIDQLKS